MRGCSHLQDEPTKVFHGDNELMEETKVKIKSYMARTV